jgi:hypothetical protein
MNRRGKRAYAYPVKAPTSVGVMPFLMATIFSLWRNSNGEYHVSYGGNQICYGEYRIPYGDNQTSYGGYQIAYGEYRTFYGENHIALWRKIFCYGENYLGCQKG